MRWSIIKLIWIRELRDQLRDRRTLFMIAVLPLLLYPLLGLGVVQLAITFVERPSLVGIEGTEHLPPPMSPAAVACWLAGVAPAGPGPWLLQLAAASDLAGLDGLRQAYPPLVVHGRFPAPYFERPGDAGQLLPQPLAPGAAAAALEAKQVDLVLRVPAGFHRTLERGERASLELAYREGDDRSRYAAGRLYGVLGRWKEHLRAIRMVRVGLPPLYDDPFGIHDPEKAKPSEKVAAEGLVDMLVRIFPFLLVMWALAGALYPAIDLCAGEKERGTMETLLISPASREEIVWGKFLTIWVFSAATALLNLVSMGISAWQLSGQLTQPYLPTAALLWSVPLVLPLSAFFSAVCLALGAYARSSKEGQYYLMPLFLFTMPLIFLTLAPGVELNQFYSLVPVTGVALLMQELLTLPLAQVRWLYFVPVFASIVLYCWLALRWAIEQFNREEVLFREAERLDVGLWLRRLFRDKEALPSTGQAVFCFLLVLGLHWLSLGLGGHLAPLVRMAVSALAFVAVPPLFMAVLLTTRPAAGLGLRLPGLAALPAAVLLAGLLALPLAELTHLVVGQFPALTELLSERQPLVEWSRALLREAWWQYLALVVVLPAWCEELAFRGFIFTGLRRRFPPGTALLLSSIFFALYHLNVFQLLPAFLLGLTLGVLRLRSGSIVPGLLFHLVHGGLVVGAALLPDLTLARTDLPLERPVRVAASLVCLVLAGVVVGLLLASGPRPTEDAPAETPAQ